MDTTLENTTLVSADYAINYYGQTIDIKNTTKVLALFIGGSGYTGDMGQYYGGSRYELYVPNSADWGKTLKLVGTAEDSHNGYDHSCRFTLNGVRHEVEGFGVDNLFNKIFKRSA